MEAFSLTLAHMVRMAPKQNAVTVPMFVFYQRLNSKADIYPVKFMAIGIPEFNGINGEVVH